MYRRRRRRERTVDGWVMVKSYGGILSRYYSYISSRLKLLVIFASKSSLLASIALNFVEMAEKKIYGRRLTVATANINHSSDGHTHTAPPQTKAERRVVSAHHVIQ
jgi:hypothetical protein